MERLYVRGSDERIKTENQISELQAASPAGLLYKDVLSGSKKRAQLERLIEDCKPGDIVWIWALDRLTREGIHATLDYLKRITAKKARVRSLKESWLDSNNPCWEIMVSCMAFGAKLERDRLIERTKAGIKRVRSERGRPVLDKAKIAAAEGTLREIAKKFGCSAVYVLKCKRESAL
jgi:DNA invertase Pin-like site-specific DNA recombinase